MNKKTVAVVTGTRAEYGLLRPVLQKLLRSAVLEPQLLVTGAHLAAEYGGTVAEIEADGTPIAARIPILKFGAGPLATADTVASVSYTHLHRPLLPWLGAGGGGAFGAGCGKGRAAPGEPGCRAGASGGGVPFGAVSYTHLPRRHRRRSGQGWPAARRQAPQGSRQ